MACTHVRLLRRHIVLQIQAGKNYLANGKKRTGLQYSSECFINIFKKCINYNHDYVTKQETREEEYVNSPVFLRLMSLEALALAQS